MKLSAPKQVTFMIAGVLWLVGLLGIVTPSLQTVEAGLPVSYGYLAALLGGLVLILGNMLDNL